MVVYNFSGEEIQSKIVYYGPGLSGKTTNLECIYQRMPTHAKGKMVSMRTRTDRTLFFDYLPLDLGEISGFKTRFLLYTVPGQVYYNATRKLVLKGVDAVVFVADSSAAKIAENKESLQNLEANLNELGLSLDSLPWVMQYNKRDLGDALPMDQLERELNVLQVPSFEATATKGDGVYETLQAIAALLFDRLQEELLERAQERGAKLPPDSDPYTVHGGPGVLEGDSFPLSADEADKLPAIDPEEEARALSALDEVVDKLEVPNLESDAASGDRDFPPPNLPGADELGPFHDEKREEGLGPVPGDSPHGATAGGEESDSLGHVVDFPQTAGDAEGRRVDVDEKGSFVTSNFQAKPRDLQGENGAWSEEGVALLNDMPQEGSSLSGPKRSLDSFASEPNPLDETDLEASDTDAAVDDFFDFTDPESETEEFLPPQPDEPRQGKGSPVPDEPPAPRAAAKTAAESPVPARVIEVPVELDQEDLEGEVTIKVKITLNSK